MVMPYRTRPTGAQPPAPARVNFDALWEKALVPAIAALGYRPVRADQDLGPLIIKDMLERLYFSDLVLADLTIPNGNVYYEIGIRHAAKNGGCVLIGADWSEPLFDVDQMRQLRYPLPEQEISDETATKIRAVLIESIPKMAGSGSPMYETLDGYPTRVDPRRAQAMQDFLTDFAGFQEAVGVVRLLPRDEQPAAARAVRDTYAAKRPVVPAVALEVMMLLRDYAGWEETIAYIDTLPESLSKLPAVRELRCLAQSNAGDHRAAIAALEQLIKLAGPSSERYGLIGGRYKRLADAAQGADRTRLLDLAINAYKQGMETDLNDYYPSSNLPRLYRRRGRPGDEERARTAASVALVACERAKRLHPDDPWIRPTLLGMAFDAGDASKAEELAEQIALEGVAAWKLDTLLKDLKTSTELPTNAAEKDHLLAVVATLEGMLSGSGG
jgi:hypothetical protein